ncbi:hypothetical protein EV200_11025 [Pedobacter psychrotolerans]|uniref:Uncharacterized protein n=1 Tax=Pedobacter psychrotolerans TaxID=1843235 RepID=A0A4R2H340_9SPHI|nr:hypothetical protein [Pedobacter psychrotolerans]TCO19303.1 hypothetical protein EV200_11025 [Pedobacter psychrotolerans]GGE69697.1 hypothetical protein GCM10011413_40370 [Pedobacter psychrotolerans]
MKKVMILATLMAGFALSNVKAQTVNGVKLSEITATYIQVRQIEKVFSEKFFVSVEYGQPADDYNNTYIKDDNGKKMEFTSALDFVNKSKSYGYELFQVFTEGENNSAVYLLKRK